MLQVFQNLLSNALKFTRHESVARISVRCERLPGVVKIICEDNGVGFEPAQAERLFRPFEIDANIFRVRTKPEFVAALKAGGFDLILADFRLPGFDGMEALELAKQLAPGVPFIFVTSTMGEHRAVEGLRNGAVDFVLKAALFRLPAAVIRALNDGRDAETRRQLESSRQQLIEIIEGTPDYVGTSTADGRTLYINRSFRELIGAASLDELEGRPIASFHPPRMRDRLVDEVLPEVRRSGFWQGENEILDGAGNSVPVLQSALAHRDGAGQITHLSTVMRDIRALKANEAALDSERAFLRSVLDAMGSRIAILDARGAIVAVNQLDQRALLSPWKTSSIAATAGVAGTGLTSPASSTTTVSCMRSSLMKMSPKGFWLRPRCSSNTN